MKQTEIEIRMAIPEDSLVVPELINAAGEGLPFFVWSQLADEGQDPWEVGRQRFLGSTAAISHKHVWVAVLEGRVAGCLICHRQPDTTAPIPDDLPSVFRPIQELENKAPGTGYVYALSTTPEQRGRGIGTRLLSFAERYRGPKGMSLIVSNANHAARRLYERCGYRESAARAMVKDGWQSTGTTWILMTKR